MNTEWKLVPVEPTPQMIKAWHDAYSNAAIKTGRSGRAYAAMLDAAPCPTCNDQGAVGNILTAEPCPDCTPAPTSHPIPTGATGDRDWELSCDECNGSGHVFVKHQVAERKTDVQEFKEECECCEGRGFNIAFEDVPGIAEYVKSCRAAATVATEVAQPAINWGAVSARIAEYAEDYELRGEDDHGREGTYTPNETERGLIIDAIHGLLADDEFMALMRPAAPAAGDALDSQAIAALRLALKYWEDRQQRYKNRSPAWVEAARAAIAQQKGEA
ncbi:hypothetical protein ACNPPY_00290 [Achromobacter sp. AGC78]